MRSTTPTEKARIAAGAVTAVVMTAVLLALALGFLLAL
ncbi:tetrahydromethanopterin S-methyltransferase subunit F [Bradyrhizobium ottawaense]